MSKITLDTIASGFALSKVNDNFERIATVLNEDVLYRRVLPGETNTLEQNLDVNDKELYNVGKLRATELYINGQFVSPSPTVTTVSAFQSFQFVATTAQTTFSVSPLTPTEESVLVSVDGLELPASSVSVSGTNVIIPACSASDVVFIKVFTTAATAIQTGENTSYTSSTTLPTTRTVAGKLLELTS